MSEERRTWRQLISLELAEHGESWDDVEECTAEDLDRVLAESPDEFDELGIDVDDRDRAMSFVLWTKSRVYFSVLHDGWFLSACSVPRHPDGKPTEHVCVP